MIIIEFMWLHYDIVYFEVWAKFWTTGYIADSSPSSPPTGGGPGSGGAVVRGGRVLCQEGVNMPCPSPDPPSILLAGPKGGAGALASASPESPLITILHTDNPTKVRQPQLHTILYKMWHSIGTHVPYMCSTYSTYLSLYTCKLNNLFFQSPIFVILIF